MVKRPEYNQEVQRALWDRFGALSAKLRMLGGIVQNDLNEYPEVIAQAGIDEWEVESAKLIGEIAILHANAIAFVRTGKTN